MEGDIFEGNWIQDRIGISGKIIYGHGCAFFGRFRDSMRNRPWEGDITVRRDKKSHYYYYL